MFAVCNIVHSIPLGVDRDFPFPEDETEDTSRTSLILLESICVRSHSLSEPNSAVGRLYELNFPFQGLKVFSTFSPRLWVPSLRLSSLNNLKAEKYDPEQNFPPF